MKWSQEEVTFLEILSKDESQTFSTMEKAFREKVDNNEEGFQEYRKADTIRRKCSRDEIPVAGLNKPDFETVWGKLPAISDLYRMQCITHDVGLNKKVSRKILSLSDLHIPFVRTDLVFQAMKDHSDAEGVVFNGDLLDGYVFSRYGKERRVAALHEYQGAFDLVKYASEHFKWVGIVTGNHDDRVSRTLHKADFEDDAIQILRPDLLQRIANGEELNEEGKIVALHKFKNVMYHPSESWYMKVGQTIFAHPHGYSNSHPGATVMKVDGQFHERYKEGGYDSVVIGHTHKIYKGVVKNRLLIEQGALCARLHYQMRPDLTFGQAMNGYAVVCQDKDGNTDFNKSGPIYLGSELPPKKSII